MRSTLLFATAIASLIAAEPPLTGAGPAAFVHSLARAPAIQAAQERILAARRGADAAGRLPDPMLGAGYARKSTGMERWPMYDISIEQPLPRWGERDARRARASAVTAMGEAELLDTVGDTAAEVAIALAEAEAAIAAMAVVDRQIARAGALEAGLAARAAAGGGIADQLGVQSRLASLRVERDTLHRIAIDAEQDVRSRLALSSDAPLPPFAAPEPAIISLDRVPGVLAAQARSAEADAMFHEARASRYPETALGLRYERELQPGDPMDTIGVEMRISLPIWQAASAGLEDAAAASRRASGRDAEGWRLRARSLLGRAERAARVAASARAAAHAASARLEAEYDTMLQAAASRPDAGLVATLDVLDRLGDAERQVVDAESAARRAVAELWRIAPPDLASGSTP